MYKRIQKLPHLERSSCFLWGPRQSGKTTLLQQLYPDAIKYDLIRSREYRRFQHDPGLLGDELKAALPIKKPVIIDEVQKVPELLDEVQWLIDNHKIQFILCGSSARKLKRGAGNLLGGRALRYELFPLVSREVPNFDLMRALNNGLLPTHYLANNPKPLFEAYIADYLKEEIATEALTRNIPAFSRFLEASAFSNAGMVNFVNIASECGVSSHTVKEYFQILEDTLIGRFIPSYRKRPKRRIIQAPKFYFFDVGIANYLLKRGSVEIGSESLGHAFEHFIFQELAAHSHYSGINYEVAYWRTASDYEVDFILGQHEIAVEVKGTRLVQPHHLKGLNAFCEEYKTKHNIVVSFEPRARRVRNIDILPWSVFLDRLWNNQLNCT